MLNSFQHLIFVKPRNKEIPKPVRNDNRACAFTLAEVLITLTIIGVIAALTIPTLMKNWQHAQLKSSYFKAYSIMSNAMKMVLVEDPIETWPAKGLNKNETDIMKMFAKKINGAKVEKSREGELPHDIDFIYTPSMMFGFDSCVTDCSFDASRYGHGVYNSCMLILVDTNGKQKPNKAGYDRFEWILSRRPNGSLQIVPPGEDTKNLPNNCTDSSCGQWGCRCNVGYRAFHEPDYFKNLP